MSNLWAKRAFANLQTGEVMEFQTIEDGIRYLLVLYAEMGKTIAREEAAFYAGHHVGFHKGAEHARRAGTDDL